MIGSKLPPLDHLLAMTDDTGVIQHATETVPNRSTGYCTDDVARAFIVALMRLEIDPRDEAAHRLAGTYLAFLHDAQLEDGRFHNFMGYDRTWLDEVGTHDSVGRALWALGYGIRHAPEEGWRRLCRTLFERGMSSLEWLQYPRSQAYAILGLAHSPRDAARIFVRRRHAVSRRRTCRAIRVARRRTSGRGSRTP